MERIEEVLRCNGHDGSALNGLSASRQRCGSIRAEVVTVMVVPCGRGSAGTGREVRIERATLLRAIVRASASTASRTPRPFDPRRYRDAPARGPSHRCRRGRSSDRRRAARSPPVRVDRVSSLLLEPSGRGQTPNDADDRPAPQRPDRTRPGVTGARSGSVCSSPCTVSRRRARPAQRRDFCHRAAAHVSGLRRPCSRGRGLVTVSA